MLKINFYQNGMFYKKRRCVELIVSREMSNSFTQLCASLSEVLGNEVDVLLHLQLVCVL